MDNLYFFLRKAYFKIFFHFARLLTFTCCKKTKRYFLLNIKKLNVFSNMPFYTQTKLREQKSSRELGGEIFLSFVNGKQLSVTARMTFAQFRFRVVKEIIVKRLFQERNHAAIARFERKKVATTNIVRSHSTASATTHNAQLRTLRRSLWRLSVSLRPLVQTPGSCSASGAPWSSAMPPSLGRGRVSNNNCS